MNINIRPTIKDDLTKIANIFKNTFNNLGEEWSDETSLNHVRENFFGPYHYVAVLDNQVIGFVAAIPLTREKGTQLFIDSICVLPKYQNKKVGTMLWDKLIKKAKNDNLKGVSLLGNESYYSYKWYEQLGMKPTNWVEVHLSL